MKQQTNTLERKAYSCPEISELEISPEILFQSDSASTIDYLTEEDGNFEWN